MKTQHTPGPWRLHEDGYPCQGSNDMPVPHATGLIESAYSPVYDDDTPESRANSRLIAAAPDLLEALKAMLEVHGVRQEHAIASVEIPQSWVELSDIARAAIAKATGEQA